MNWAKRGRLSRTLSMAVGLALGVSALTVTSAIAGGDIGGDCCADLEERVAELEATTARKGNRKVSLTISGQVNKAVMYFNDGDKSDVYVVDNTNSSSRFRLTGSARIRTGWSAGYRVEIEFDSAESGVVNLADDDGDSTNGALDLREAYWWIKSDSYGRVSVGQGWSATGDVADADLSGTSVISYVAVADVGGGILFRTAGGTLSAHSIGSVSSDFETGRIDRVRYDSNTYRGFMLSASWGEDDTTDVALYFARTKKDYTVVAAIGYTDNEDETNNYDQVVGSVAVKHIPTGFNVSIAAGDRDSNGVSYDEQYIYAKVGLTRKYNSRGATSISFDYFHGDEISEATGDYTRWGVQVVQNIDAAAMELYAAYSHHEYDNSTTNYQDIDVVMAGARIKF